MIDFFQAIIFGIVEGITEFLPISSTAHLILVSEAFGIAQTDFVKSFEIIIQLGAILAVIFLYWKDFLRWEVLKRLAVAVIPTGILGLIFYRVVKTYLIGNVSVVLWALFLGGILLIIFEKWHREKEDVSEEVSSIPYGKCFLIGLFQSIAMIPGISRSAATILGGLVLGVRRRAIVEFSFLLAVPTMMAATGLDLAKSAGNFSLSQFNVLAVGFLTSFVMAIIGIKFLLSYIQKHSFTAFGVYRILAAGIFLVGIILF